MDFVMQTCRFVSTTGLPSRVARPEVVQGDRLMDQHVVTALRKEARSYAAHPLSPLPAEDWLQTSREVHAQSRRSSRYTVC